jgi:diguanylate cyclase (GGDEF)-like protein/PAS domain S-box-containing protein
MAENTEAVREILEAALSELEEGIAILDGHACVLFWNPAAEAVTGYHSAEMLSRPLPMGLYQVDPVHHAEEHRRTHSPMEQDTLAETTLEASRGERPLLVRLRHHQGHSLPAMLRTTTLRNSTGKRFGSLLRFHPMEEIDALPHGSIDIDEHEHRIEHSQADMEDRLDEAWHEWSHNAVPFGLLWIEVDQAPLLRQTHGRDASEAMLAIVERTLLHGLRPAEILGRWGTSEFLVLCHERTQEMLEAHAHHVGGLARTADFRWWGDRVTLTVSIGAAQAVENESLRCLLKRAQKAMRDSTYGGGNQVVVRGIEGSPECSQS